MGYFKGANVDNFKIAECFHDKVVHIDLKDPRERSGILKIKLQNGNQKIENDVISMFL
jgi:hypothetical protein